MTPEMKTVLALSAVASACAAPRAPAEQSVSHASEEAHAEGGLSPEPGPGAGLQIRLAADQVLTVAISRHRDGAAPLMQRYFQSVMPIARPHGFAPLGALEVLAADAGGFEPNNFFGFYAFPSTAAAERFASDPRWPAVRATRPEIWSELRISHFVVDASTVWSFEEHKVYEVRYEWGVLEVDDGVTSGGGRVVANLAGGTHEMLPVGLGVPTMIRIIEWPSLESARGAARPRTSVRVDSFYTAVGSPDTSSRGAPTRGPRPRR